MKERYNSIALRADTLDLIQTMNRVIADYQRQGYKLTVRQLYYQLVAKAIIPNTLQSYKRVASIMNDGRIAGLIDWSAIEDRTRDFIKRSRWHSGGELLDACAQQFHMDMWDNQRNRVFVIVEKEALAGVLERVCRKWDVPLLAARGYPSASVLREFAVEDLIPTIDQGGQDVTILHLGDHDPSGIDMSRDLTDRLGMFCRGAAFDLKRIALTMDQIEEERPPPNPAKITDSRFENYAEKYGDESWELDALTPSYLNDLVEEHIHDLVDEDEWTAREQEIDGVQKRLQKLAKKFDKE